MNLLLIKSYLIYLLKKLFLNNPTLCGDSYFIVENCLAEKEKDLREHTIKPVDTITPQNPKNNSTDEHKSNIEKKQNEHRDRPETYEALMAEIFDMKGFVMEELYIINKHVTDLPSRIDLGKCQINIHFKGGLYLKKLH